MEGQNHIFADTWLLKDTYNYYQSTQHRANKEKKIKFVEHIANMQKIWKYHFSSLVRTNFIDQQDIKSVRMYLEYRFSSKR